MKVVGLISGGKDSIHNLLHCIALGHEVVRDCVTHYTCILPFQPAIEKKLKIIYFTHTPPLFFHFHKSQGGVGELAAACG